MCVYGSYQAPDKINEGKIYKDVIRMSKKMCPGLF